MQIEKREYKVFDFDELSEEAKDKAIEENWDINADYGWQYDDEIYYLPEKYGLKVSQAEMCFDLDRGNYVYFDAKHDGGDHIAQIFVEDYKKFAKIAGIDLRKERNLDGNIKIECEHFGGGDGRNYLVVGHEVSEDAERLLEGALQRFLEEVLQALKDDYEWRTSREAVIDTLVANEYKFFENGKMFNL